MVLVVWEMERAAMHHQCQRHSDSVYIEELQINQEYENQNPPKKRIKMPLVVEVCSLQTEIPTPMFFCFFGTTQWLRGYISSLTGTKKGLAPIILLLSLFFIYRLCLFLGVIYDVLHTVTAERETKNKMEFLFLSLGWTAAGYCRL